LCIVETDDRISGEASTDVKALVIGSKFGLLSMGTTK